MTLAHAPAYVTDDDRSMRKAIGRLSNRRLLSRNVLPGAREFLAQAPHTGPSCVILDLNMPGLNRLEVQGALVESDSCQPYAPL
jgi:FixJ family two-component response regulator